MGLINKGLGWIQSAGKKQCKSLYWRVKAEIERAVRIGSTKKVKFQYDPHSYSLNFDDGLDHQGIVERVRGFETVKFKGCPDRTVWVYIVFAKS